MKMKFQDKVILVTGASSGIGADTARLLAKLGGKVAIVSPVERDLREVAETIKKDGSIVPLVIVADVTKDVKRMIDETVKHFGKLDVLVNNAGILIRDSVTNFDVAEFDRLFDINVRSVITLTQAAVPHLEKTKGNIVNVSSILAQIVFENAMSYSMSKAAVKQFTKSCALDLAPKRIRVNCVQPGITKTSIFAVAGSSPDAVEARFQKLESIYPVGRGGEVSDISAAIAYLASDSASFVTGTALVVDGGAIVAGATE